MKELPITPPEGYEIDRDESTLDLIKFKKIDRVLPKTWEEYERIREKKKIRSTFITHLGVTNPINQRKFNTLSRLIILRDYYNGIWKPNWEDSGEEKFAIAVSRGNAKKISTYCWHEIFVFRNRELRGEFFDNFKKQIEQCVL